jgi:hypothetical protein
MLLSKSGVTQTDPTQSDVSYVSEFKVTLTEALNAEV